MRNPEKYNPSGCKDMTAYEAIKTVEREEIRYKKLLSTIFSICELAGFHLEGRIVLKDNRTGRVWR